jgi:YVTN family beta-propeller protein
MRALYFIFLFYCANVWAQVPNKDAYRHESDSRKLDESLPTIMPYNRLLASAGKIVSYGNSRLENHTLDVATIPDGQHLVVEDRYGIAILNKSSQQIVSRWAIDQDKRFGGMKNTYSGIKSFVFDDQTYIVWSAAGQENEKAGILIATWNGQRIEVVDFFSFQPLAPAPGALPNEIEVLQTGADCFLYVVLNGNNQLAKIDFAKRELLWAKSTGVAPFGVKITKNKVYVSNWAGPVPNDSRLETAGVPYGEAYVDPRTGATLKGSISVLDAENGGALKEIEVGLHPNAMVLSPDQKLLYVANGNSDDVSVIDVTSDQEIKRIPVGLFQLGGALIGSSPNGLALDQLGQTLYVSNGLDHALAVVKLTASPKVVGYIPTEAYPSGLFLYKDTIYVCNLEGRGARVFNNSPEQKRRFPKLNQEGGAFNAHEQLASLSIIPIPRPAQLRKFTKQVKTYNFEFRVKATRRPPRANAASRPIPERIGEPSVFKHVLYIIKENRTYDQVYGDLKQGRGKPELCIYGDSVSPNQHKLALEYALLDNYHASGKSSAEGHQWTDAGIVSDYVEKSVRGWFRSYPHRQYDAMVYTREGFIWNHALDHGKTVRIYGEACDMEFDHTLDWTAIYKKYLDKTPFEFKNTTTISRVRPILSQNYPGYDDPKINDQMRADAFIYELEEYEKLPGDQLPQLMVLALPNDHTAGTTPGFPTPRAQVADNDLALGRIIEAVSKSKFWDSTVVFVTEDDSQGGWDHISAYRTGALVLSPYSRLGKTIHTNYSQISMLRTIEQILGLPPMNAMDATARPMFECFSTTKNSVPFTHLKNRIPLNEMNKALSMLEGKALFYAQQSLIQMSEGVDKGEDDMMNRILWFAAKGEQDYPLRKSRE